MAFFKNAQVYNSRENRQIKTLAHNRMLLFFATLGFITGALLFLTNHL